jgi:hypothetical protein
MIGGGGDGGDGGEVLSNLRHSLSSCVWQALKIRFVMAGAAYHVGWLFVELFGRSHVGSGPQE